MVVPYREDLDAAQARIAALEHELAKLRGEPSIADVAAREEIVDLRTKNWELQVELARARDESVRPAVGEPPNTAIRRLEHAVADLEAENAALREAARANAVDLERARSGAGAGAATTTTLAARHAGPPARMSGSAAAMTLGGVALFALTAGVAIHSVAAIVTCVVFAALAGFVGIWGPKS
jgi:hypothetical protein